MGRQHRGRYARGPVTAPVDRLAWLPPILAPSPPRTPGPRGRSRPPGWSPCWPGGLQLLVANLTRRRSVPVLLPGLARAAGAGASEPYPFIVSPGGQAEIILGPYEVIHIVAVPPVTRPALA
jgi:hypothetical protein